MKPGDLIKYPDTVSKDEIAIYLGERVGVLKMMQVIPIATIYSPQYYKDRTVEEKVEYYTDYKKILIQSLLRHRGEAVVSPKEVCFHKFFETNLPRLVIEKIFNI